MTLPPLRPARALGLAIPALALAGAAAAQPVNGVYIGAGAGVNFSENSSLRFGQPLASQFPLAGVQNSGRAVFATGVAVVGSLGWGFGNGLRLEMEGHFRQNDVEKISGFAGAQGANRADGYQRIYGFMANALYDFEIPGLPWVTPYIGGGIGYAWREWSGVSSATGAFSGVIRSAGTEAGIAWQAIGGAALPIPGVPGLAATMEYRYFGMQSGEYQTRVLAVPSGVPVAGSRLRSEGVAQHSALLGLRYAFNVAPPPPPPAPAATPAPARTFLVFFDWDRADLTDRARQIIAEAANSSRTVASTRIEVSGHADRTGSAAYNQRLSVRRAEAVAAELVRNGVQRSAITVQGFGFDRPLVPTAMGVREPQNRRVEIVLR